MNRTNNIRLLKISLIIIGILTVSGYGISRSLNYAQGPYIEILEPVADSTATTSLIRLRGRAERKTNSDRRTRKFQPRYSGISWTEYLDDGGTGPVWPKDAIDSAYHWNNMI